MKKPIFNTFIGIGLCLGGSLFFSSCSKDDDNPSDRTFGSGIYVTNEGQFNKANGDVSFIDKNKAVEPNVFLAVNGRPAGDVIQSMLFHNEKAYIVANNSKTIEVANAKTFKSENIITGLEMPRYMAAAGSKGYVSEYVTFSGNGRISVVDLKTNAVTKTIEVGPSPEKLLIFNNKLYVVNSGSNTVSVINLTTETAEAPITVGDAPNSLVLDANNKLWVLCGAIFGSTDGSLVRINPATNAIEKTYTFPAGAIAPQYLTINATRNTLLYTYDNKVFKMGISENSLPGSAVVSRSFMSIGINPENSEIMGGTGSYTSAGKVIRYNFTGAVIDSFTVGIAPNGFYFK